MACAISSGVPVRRSGTPAIRPGLAVGAAGEAVQHPGFDRAGRDRVDADAKRCAFQRR